MKKWLLRGAAVLAALVLLAGAAIVAGEQMAQRRAQRVVDVPAVAIVLTNDAAALERGRYLYGSRGCGDCHGADGGGRTLVDDGKGLKIAGPNITMGNARIAAYQPQDWDRSIRHGVAPGGRPLRVMPSEDYNRLTDADLAAIVVWLQQRPARAGNLEATVQLPLVARVMYGFGRIPDAVEKIDHSLPPAQPVAEGVTVQHGEYVAQMCKGCHGGNFAGGPIPGAPPDWPAAVRLAPGEGSVMPAYTSEAAFVAMLRSGKRPDGSPIRVMPFEALATMNDVDSRALYLYLKALR